MSRLLCVSPAPCFITLAVGVALAQPAKPADKPPLLSARGRVVDLEGHPVPGRAWCSRVADDSPQ